MALEFRRFELIEQWMAQASAEQCEAMRQWVSALNGDPRELANRKYTNPARRGFPVYVALVPGTSAAVAFMYHEAPMRVVTFVRILSSVQLDEPL